MAVFSRIVLTMFSASVIQGCSTKGPAGLFEKKTPHEQYASKLRDAGLHNSEMGKLWFSHADESLKNAPDITTPYKETGYFAAERIPAAAWKFEARRGEQLMVTVVKRPAQSFILYLDLWQDKGSSGLRSVASADTSQALISYEIKETGIYRLRVQPELLQSGEYTINITTGPSLEYPVRSSGRSHIGSFFGADRDEGSRRHEGVDIFATKRSPAVASANGIITRVTENELGGKVVFMRPKGKNYTLYYAHLDEQLARDGETVTEGDTLGLIGNTGNARNTPPHLHFGIYTFGGAIDPLPFINPVTSKPPPITAALNMLNATGRSGRASVKLLSSPATSSPVVSEIAPYTVMYIESAYASWYKVRLPDEKYGYISSSGVVPAATTLRNISPANRRVYDKPDTTAARKTILPDNASVNVLGNFKEFYLIKTGDLTGWISK